MLRLNEELILIVTFRTIFIVIVLTAQIFQSVDNQATAKWCIITLQPGTIKCCQALDLRRKKNSFCIRIAFYLISLPFTIKEGGTNE